MTAVDIDAAAPPPIPDWSDAACRTGDPSIWFPASSHPELVDEARAVCVSCPVRDECLDYALEHRQEFGVWGGMTETQRHRIRHRRTDRATEWNRYHNRQAAMKVRKQRVDTERRPATDADLAAAHDIVAAVADAHGLNIDMLLGRGRSAHVVAARHVAMRRVRAETGLPFTSIGRMFDRDHTTVMAAVNGRTR